MVAKAEDKTIQSQYAKGPLDVVKHWWVYFLFSVLVLLLPGIIVMGMSIANYSTHAPLRLGIDFTGGTMLQYGFSRDLSQEDVGRMREVLAGVGVSNPVIQLQKAEAGMKGIMGNVTTEQVTGSEQVAEETSTAPGAEKAAPSPATEETATQSVTELFKDAEVESQQAAAGPQEAQIMSVISIRTQDLSTEKTIEMQKALQDEFGEYTLLQKNRVGPTLAKELFVKAAWGLILAYALIVVYLSVRFQWDYAVTAIVALLHDTIFMLGAFSILGWIYQIEVDSMFVTAILTVIGFSVHDTIVVFDRIRENARVLYTKKLPFADIVNISVNQTLARSINTSLTALITLFALYFFGGESTKNFVLALILGIIVGTYSSIFIASALLAWWRSRNSKAQATSVSANPQTA